MHFTETKLDGAYIIELEPIADERGFFARVWCREELEAHGLCGHLEQVNLSYNRLAGTLRGMHFQVPPHGEVKLVQCLRGAILDVIVDLRGDSRSYLDWVPVELRADNRKTLYVPEGFAHGFQTLEDDTEVIYHVSEPYTPGAERGVRFDDPAIRVRWPLEVTAISVKDRNWSNFEPGRSTR